MSSTIIKFVFLISILLSCVKGRGEYSRISNAGISIEYPFSWESLEVENYSILVKETGTSTNSVLCVFAVEVDDDFDSNDTYSEYWKNKMLNSTYLENWILLSEANLQFRGINAVEFIYSCSIEGLKTKGRVLIMKHKNAILNLSMTSSSDEYDKNKSITDKIFESVEFKPDK